MTTTQTSTDLALCFCVPDHCGRTAAEGCVNARAAAIRRAMLRKAAVARKAAK